MNEEIFEDKIILVTMHRREKFGDEFKDVLETLKQIAADHSGYRFIYPVHLNPNVLNPVKEILGEVDNFHLIEPLDYMKFIYLMSRCHLILSDSGGVQEECYVFNKPIIVLRDVYRKE